MILSVVGVKKIGYADRNEYEATVAIDNPFDMPLEIMSSEPLKIDTIYSEGYETKAGEAVIGSDYGPGRTTTSAVLYSYLLRLGTSFVIPEQSVSVRSIPGLGSSLLYCSYKPVMGPAYTGPIR